MSGIIGISPDMRSGVVGAWPSGHVIQTISTDTVAQTNVNSTSLVAITGLTAAITPRSTSNKILVSIVPDSYVGFTGAYYPILTAELLRGGSSIHLTSTYYYAEPAANGYMEMGTSCSMDFLDSPNTTSAVTYSVSAKSNVTGPIHYFKINSTITLMEIAG